MTALLFSHLRRKPRLLLVRFPSFSPPLPSPSVTPPPIRLLHGFPSPPKSDSFFSPPSRILQSTTPVASELEEGDAAMNEFLSRFVWAIRGKLVEAYPIVSKETLDAMLLVICQKVVAEMEKAGDGAAAADPPIDLSEDLWKTIWEVSNSVHEAINRDGMRVVLKKYLHCDEVKDMCHFAAEIGIRGSTLRELRFKWAREKLEEVEFYRSLDQMREQDKKQEEEEKALSSGSGVDPGSCWVEGEKGGKTKVLALPQRKGKIKYKIYGLDLSDPKWAEVAERVEEAEKHIVPEEPQPVDGKCKKVEEKLLALKAKRDDPTPLLAEWAELLQPKKVDWIALLDRIKQRNVDLYFKEEEEDEKEGDETGEEEGGEAPASKCTVQRGKSKEEKIKEAAEIGYKVTGGPLDPSENPFKPYEPIFAVVQIGSHQFKVSNGDSIFTERLKFCEVNDKLILNRVLMLGSKTQTIIGRPVLPDAAVYAVVEEHALDAKVIIFKKKRRKNYRRTKGHRQELTKLRITDIQGIDKSANVATNA